MQKDNESQGHPSELSEIKRRRMFVGSERPEKEG